MVTHKIVVIRGREISVIFYYSDFSGCTLQCFLDSKNFWV